MWRLQARGFEGHYLDVTHSIAVQLLRSPETQPPFPGAPKLYNTFSVPRQNSRRHLPKMLQIFYMATPRGCVRS